MPIHDLKDQIARLPEQPGVYLYLNTEGETIYANRYMIWGHMAWGKLREYEVYEDTQASKALDAHLEADGEARNSSSVSAVSSVPR